MNNINTILSKWIKIIESHSINNSLENLIGYNCIYEGNYAIVKSIDCNKLILETQEGDKILKENEIPTIINESYKIENFLKYLLQNNLSELEIYQNVSDKFKHFSGWKKAEKLLEELTDELEESDRKFLYDLKDLYVKLLRSNLNNVYDKPLDILMKIINLPDDTARIESVVNELQVYNWIPLVDNFIDKYMDNSSMRKNIKFEGKSSKIYTVSFFINGGQMFYLDDKWFFITDSQIMTTTLGDWIREFDKITMENLAQALSVAKIDSEMISFEINENLTISYKFDFDGNFYINGNAAESGTNIKTFFMTTEVPMNKKNLLPILETVYNNIDNFIELDICLKIINSVKKNYTYLFNYIGKIYRYDIDKKIGNQFYECDSAEKTIDEINKEWDYDATEFLKDILDKESEIQKNQLDQKKVIRLEIDKTNKIINDLKSDDEIQEEPEIKELLEKLYIQKAKLLSDYNLCE